MQKKDLIYGHPEPSESKEPSLVKRIDTPPLPSFETKWLKSDTIVSAFLLPKVHFQSDCSVKRLSHLNNLCPYVLLMHMEILEESPLLGTPEEPLTSS